MSYERLHQSEPADDQPSVEIAMTHFNKARQEFDKETPFGQPPTNVSVPFSGVPHAPYIAARGPQEPVVAIAVEPEVASSFVSEVPLGTSNEFSGFFFLNCLLGVTAYLFSLCLAGSHAARLGARAGFGMHLLLAGFYTFFTYMDDAAQNDSNYTFYMSLAIILNICGIALFSGSMRVWRQLKRMHAVGRVQQVLQV
eukprot:TRINITY_DN2452_c0_g1_i1.p1 TRINITY_DN2452_c0_g1~~TRINITY_DN2452_c0_g1_i1.p1  ORF type:complete len:197 (+),score=28.39 TRINITY_DN2452_c0_g1_i1:50-640(+)